VLLRIKLALNRRPMGRIERTNMSLVIWTSFAPSKRQVVRCKTRVPMAYRELGDGGEFKEQNLLQK
jgi:hypothetical protein